MVLLAGTFALWKSPAEPANFVSLFEGISFRVEALPATTEGRGKVYTAIADLKSPGLDQLSPHWIGWDSPRLGTELAAAK